MSLNCSHCNASLPDNAVDRSREIATCPSCHRLVDVRPQLQAPPPGAAVAGSVKPRMRAAVPLPAGLTIAHEGHEGILVGYREGSDKGTLVVIRRWRRTKHFVLLGLALGLATLLVLSVKEYGFSGWSVIGTLLLASWSWMLLAMFLNTTKVRANMDRVTVQHGPIPVLGLTRGQDLATSSIKQLFARKQGHFQVGAQLADGNVVTLVAPLVAAEQAVFIEQQLEGQLGLVDFEVPGELDTVLRATSIPGAAKGVLAVAGIAPMLMMVGIGALVFAIFPKTRLDGSLKLDLPAGAATFTPNDCDSGQFLGFFGVGLTTKGSNTTRVRVIQDAVKGPALSILHQGQEHRVDPSACTTLDVVVRNTNTTVNDVRVLEGSLDAKCEAVTGRVTFEGCY